MSKVAEALRDCLSILEGAEADAKSIDLMRQIDPNVGVDIDRLRAILVPVSENKTIEEEPVVHIKKKKVFNQKKITPAKPKKSALKTKGKDISGSEEEARRVCDEYFRNKSFDEMVVKAHNEMMDEVIDDYPFIKVFLKKNAIYQIIDNVMNDLAEFENEEWRPVDDCQDVEVSNFGRVRNSSSLKIYARTFLEKEQKMVSFLRPSTDSRTLNFGVDRLVLEAFVSKNLSSSPIKRTIVHLDGNRKNCRLENLKWKYPNNDDSSTTDNEELETAITGDPKTFSNVEEMLKDGTNDLATMFEFSKDLDWVIRMFNKKRAMKLTLSTSDQVIPILQFAKSPDNPNELRSIREIQQLIYEKYDKLNISTNLIEKVLKKDCYKNLSDLVF